MDFYERRICKAFEKKGHLAVTFETFSGFLNGAGERKLVHTHSQIVPISMQYASTLKARFIEEALDDGLLPSENGEYPTDLNFPYIRVSFQDEFIVFVPSSGRMDYAFREYNDAIAQQQQNRRKAAPPPLRVINPQFGRYLMIFIISPLYTHTL